ncbi:MAG: methyltransferase [Chitinophagaceae bacterium]|nr:methyltransferase [Chitinophagaceae bacterium]
MANSYFSFKQFKVEQGNTAMKVCTDACLFGSWVASHLKGAASVLDIGTGTGLLSLMFAQESRGSVIDAVEPDAAAFHQATDNFESSPWSNQLRTHHCSVQEFKANNNYDLIITNPPFYENSLLSNKDSRNKAMHDTSLTLETLSGRIDALASVAGRAAVLLPSHRAAYFTGLMGQLGWHCITEVSVKQSPTHTFFRSMLCYGRMSSSQPDRQEMTIRDAGNNYSPEFIHLLQDYYLYL